MPRLRLPKIQPPPAGPLLSRMQLSRLADLLALIERALSEKRPVFHWCDGARKPWTRLLRQAGVVLMTPTAMLRRGHEPKRGARPVGTAYFGAPIKQDGELYVWGLQTRPRPGVAGGRRTDENSGGPNPPPSKK